MNGLPFENLPAGRPDPTALVRQQFDQAIRQLDVQYENKYQDLNRKYDWDRYKRNPDEIGQIRGMLRSQIENQKRQLQVQYKQQTDQFNLIDQTLGPEQAEQAKWRMVAGSDVAGRMFPKPTDYRLEHQRTIAEIGRLMSYRDQFVPDTRGRLYYSKTDEKGRPTGKVDKSQPATEAEIQGWTQSIRAIESLETYEREQIFPNLTTADITATRLQDLLLQQRQESWRKRIGKKMWGMLETYKPIEAAAISRIGKRFMPETPGTFSDKVSATMIQPVAEPRAREPEQKITRKQLLAEYKRLGGGQTTEGREFADRYLR